MSYSVYLSGSGFNAGEWEDRVLEVTGEDGPWQLLPIMEVIQEDSILEDGLLLVNGSIRGVRVNLDEDGLLVEAPDFASRADWALLFDLVEMGVAMGATVNEDAEYLASGFDAGRVEAAFTEWWALCMKSVQNGEPDRRYLLPLQSGLSLILDKAMIDLGPEGLESCLLEQVRVLGNAHACNPIDVEREDGERLTYCAWGLIPSLVPKSTPTVVFPDGGEPATDYIISLEVLADLLDGKIVDAGGAWLLPEINPATDEGAAIIMQLIAQAEPASDLPSGPADGDGPDIVRLLTDGPLFVLVALMSDNHDQMKKDISCFARAVPPAANNGEFGQLFSSALAETFQDLQKSLQRVVDGLDEDDGVVPVLSLIGGLISQLPPEIGPPYRDGLLHLGQALVDGSGGFLSSEKKRKAQCLQAVKQMLHPE